MAYKIPSFESFYSGTYSSLEPGPDYGPLFTGYRIPFRELGAPTSPQTANQISEVAARLSEGTRVVEIGALQPEVFETIPTQQFQEIKQLTKLTGAEPTVHGPLIDPAGFTDRGWSEVQRQESERHILQAVERAHELSEKGNIPVNIHATIGVPSYEWMPGKEGEEKKSVVYIANRETGEIVPVKRERRALPKPPEPIILPNGKKIEAIHIEGNIYEVPAEMRIEEYNRMTFIDPLSNVEYNNNYMGHRLKEAAHLVEVYQDSAKIGENLEKIYGEELKEAQNAREQLEMGRTELKTVQNLMEDYDFRLRELYNEAYLYSDKKNREILEGVSKKYDQELKMINEKILSEEQKAELERDPSRYPQIINDIASQNPRAFAEIVKRKSQAEKEIIEGLRRIKQPKKFIEAEEFALDKTKDTISNVALKAFKEFGEKAPVVCVENVFPNMVFGRAESLRKLIDASRETFVEKAKQQGMSDAKARDVAKKLIGATWDVGHINMLRKYGYGEEEGVFKKEKFAKEMAKEVSKVAGVVKHVHLTDNFGYNDTHLPPGMGEVPFKAILAELEKAGYSGKKIIEAGGFVAQKLGMPTPYVLEAFGSPLYAAAMEPGWNQVKMRYGVPQGYFSGYGMMLPEQHFSMYGSGFASLPQELGGQMPGRGQRFSGAPME